MSENADEIKNADLIDESVNARVEMAINKAMSIYLTRLKMGMIDEGLEASFQMHLAGLLRDELELLTIDKNERFVVELEKNMGDKNYVDICVEYHKNGCLNELYPIELKFKKESQTAGNQAVINSFVDIYKLEQLINQNNLVKSCCFIFLTNYERYTKQPKNGGTREVFSMYHNSKIEPNQSYKDDSKTFKRALLKKFKNELKELKFNNSYTIKYQKLQCKDKNYYFFILSIPPKPSERAKC